MASKHTSRNDKESSPQLDADVTQDVSFFEADTWPSLDPSNLPDNPWADDVSVPLAKRDLRTTSKASTVLEPSEDNAMAPDHKPSASFCAESSNNEEPNAEQSAILEALSREALATVEQYDNVIQRLTDEPESPIIEELSRVRDEQVEALDRLRAATLDKGGKLPDSSGFIGSMTTVASCTAARLGRRTALHALQAGEYLRQWRFERVADRHDIDQDVFRMLRHRLIPQQERHLSALSRLRMMA